MIRRASHLSRFAIACGAMLMLDAAPTSAQRAPSSQKAAAPTPPPQATPEPPAAATESTPAKSENPGILNELGKLFVNPADLFPSLKPSETPAPIQPGVAAPPAVAAPPTTTTTPAAPPASALVPQVIQGRASCPVAVNGAPDCKAGADKLCQEKGFSGGKSLDVDSAQTCSTKALLAGARTLKDICKTENFVTRAMCQ